jgi:hypothetical protein
MKNTTTTTTTTDTDTANDVSVFYAALTSTTRTTRTTTLPFVNFESATLLTTLTAPQGQKCEHYGIPFRVITEANFQAAMNRAAAHGRDGGMPPQEW